MEREKEWQDRKMDFEGKQRSPRHEHIPKQNRTEQNICSLHGHVSFSPCRIVFCVRKRVIKMHWTINLQCRVINQAEEMWKRRKKRILFSPNMYNIHWWWFFWQMFHSRPRSWEFFHVDLTYSFECNKNNPHQPSTTKEIIMITH